MFKPDDLSQFPNFSSEAALKLFKRSLQDAHAGELAAAYAYTGHGLSLFVQGKKEKQEILKIRDEELHHRMRIREMMIEVGTTPRGTRELLMGVLGLSIGFLCLFGGWFIPMYGAGRLESSNIFEYEVAARLAYLCGFFEFVNEFIEFGELEWITSSILEKKPAVTF